ncbi:MAG TPA: TolC family protein [Gemmatimonadales bacterium]|nr:TolC family protein [Gemmatimonadales bacterium]
MKLPRLLRATLAGLFVANAPAALGAQRPDPLGHLVAEALRSNLGLEAERFAERRTAADVRAARGLFFPTLGLASRYSRLGGVPNLGDLVNPAYATLNQLTGTNRFPTDVDMTFPQRHESRLQLVQPVFNAEIFANYSAARARRDGQRMQLAAAARQLAADVQLAYLQQASAWRVVQIHEAALALVRENERVAERLLAAGRATPEAVHRARAERADVEQQLAEAQERRVAAARALNQILRRPLDAAVEVIPDSAFDLPLDVSPDSAVTRALAAREELRQVDAGVRGAQAAGRAATAAFLPSVSLALDYGFQGPDFAFRRSDDYWVASLVVSWNLFNGGRDAAARSAAGYEEDRARALRQDLAERIALQVRTAYEAAGVARAAIATADTRLEAARRTFELVRRRSEEGVASPIEFVDARSAYTSAQLNRALTAHRYAMRYVELERAAALRRLDTLEETSR